MAQDFTSEVVSRMLDRTLKLKKGETITVETWNNGLKFALEVVKQSRRRGAIPLLLLEDEEAYLDGINGTPKDVMGLMGKHEYGLLSASDAYVFIPGPPLGVYYKSISREQYADSTKYNQSWYKVASKAKLRGARLAFGYVGKDLAKLLEKSVGEVTQAQLEANLADLNRISETGMALASRLPDGREVVVRTGSSRFVFTVRGELEVEDGVLDDADIKSGNNVTYLPPGYVLKTIAKSSANGSVVVSRSPSTGGMIEDALLQFKKGRVASWSSVKSKGVLDGLLDGGEAKHTVAYFSIGLNPRLKYGYGLDRFVKGAVCFYGFGFTAVCKDATVSAGGRKIVEDGKVLL
jgi:leucyl aminopeptidase (aminopeptidase T)